MINQNFVCQPAIENDEDWSNNTEIVRCEWKKESVQIDLVKLKSSVFSQMRKEAGHEEFVQIYQSAEINIKGKKLHLGSDFFNRIELSQPSKFNTPERMAMQAISEAMRMNGLI